LRSFWFWKRSPEPLLGSFLDVQRYLQNPNSRVVSGIFASFSRALEPWAVQNIQKGKKVVECKSCRANRNVQKDVEQQKYGNHPLPAVIVARGCLCLGTEIANSPCSWCAGNMSPLACRRGTVVTCSRAIYPTVAPLQVRRRPSPRGFDCSGLARSFRGSGLRAALCADGRGTPVTCV